MPVDPSIISGIQAPQQPNMLATLAGVQSLKTAGLQQNALAAQIQSNQAQSQAIQSNTDANGNVDWKGATSALAKNPSGGYNLPAFATTAQGLQKGQVDLDTGSQALAMKKAAAAAQIGVAVLTNPNAGPQDYINGIIAAQQSGQIDGPTASNAIVHASSTFGDPAAFRSYLQNGLASLPPEIQAQYVKPVLGTINTGGGTAMTATSPITGVPTQTGYMPNTASVAEQTARIPTFANGQPGSVPAGSLMPPNLLPPGSAYGSSGQPPPIPSVAMPAGMPTSNGQAAPLPGGPMPSGANPGAPASAPAGPPGFLPSAPPLGATARADTTATSDAQMGQSLIAQGDAQAPQIATLRNMRADLQNFKSGPTSSSWLALKQLATTAGITSPETQQSVASQEGFNKLAANLVSAQSQTMGVPTDSKVLVAQTGNPNATLSNLGNKEMINYLIGNSQFTQAKSQAWTAAQSSPTPPTYAQFQNQWNKTADPAVFHYANMEPAQRTNYLKSLSPAERATFQQKGNTALQNGWITPGQ